IIVKVHLTTCFHSALDRVSHGLSAVLQKLRHATWIRLACPLFRRQLAGELGGVFGNEYQTYKMDMSEKFGNGGAALHRSGLKSGFWNGLKQVDQYRIVSVPRVQQYLQQALVRRVRHTLSIDQFLQVLRVPRSLHRNLRTGI